MLKRNLMNKSWNQSLNRTFTKKFSSFDSIKMRPFKPFATSSQIENDFEIDLISLKKTRVNNGHKLDMFYLTQVKQALFTRPISKDSNSTKKNDKSNAKKFEKNDQKEFLDFVQRYYDEMQVFLKFLMDSYNGKIISFGQLTSTELSNSLYVFKDYYSNNKIPQVNRYNYISYNYMFTKLLKYLGRFPDFPQFLTNELLPSVKNGQMILTLYKNKVINFTDELNSLSNEFNFFDLTLKDLSSKIDEVLNKFNDFVVGNSKFDASYFQVIIQARRYQSLKDIIDLTPDLEAKYLILLINDPELPSVSNKLQEITEDDKVIEKTFNKYRKELDFIKFLLAGKEFQDFAEFSAFIYNEATLSSNDTELKGIFNKVLCGLSSLYGKGILGSNDLMFLDRDFNLMKVLISDNVKENYEASLIYELGIYKYLDCLRYLNSHMGDVKDVSKSEILENLDIMIKSFKGNRVILERFTAVKEMLSILFSKIPWKRTSIFILANDPTVYSSLMNCNISNGLIDISKRESGVKGQPNQSLMNNLSEYSHELSIFKEKELGGYSFKDSSSEIILYLLKNTSINIDKERKQKLFGLLSQLFNMNLSINFLDGLSKHEIKNVKPYLQIPDELQIHNFYKELDVLRKQILMKSFSNSSSHEVLSTLNKSIDAVINSSTESSPPGINKDNLRNFVRLSNRLASLFEYNGGYTAILDTIVQSQSVFENFEKKITKSNMEYKQIPDDFFLEQYLTELIQLKEELGMNFSKASSQSILLKLETLMHKEKIVEKKVIWRKLLFNLTNLFKIINDNTFILDDIIVNGESFIKFESQLAYKKLLNHPSVIGNHSILFNHYFDDISEILKSLNVVDKLGIWNMSEAEFDRILQYHLGTLDKSVPGYQIKKFLVESMKDYNSKIEYYPNFLQQLFEIKSNNLNKVLSTCDTEDIYKALIENIEYEGNNQDGIEILSKSESYKHPQSEKYNNSEESLSNLIRSEKSIDLDSNKVLKEIDFKSFAESDSKMQDAITSALKGKVNNLSQHEIIAKNNNINHDKKKSILGTEKYTDPVRVNKSSVEDFLLNAQKEKKLAKERKFRESKAYDWSKSMYNSHRSLESHNFFNPLYDLNLKVNKISTEPTGLERTKGGNEYLLLLLNGKTIRVDVNPLGKEPTEDIFKILNKFDKNELNIFLKHFKKLQHRNWKLIGSKSKNNEQKYLILWRNSKPVSITSKIWKKLKLVFATTGIIFTVLLGLDYWTSSETQHNNSKTMNSIEGSILNNEKISENVTENIDVDPKNTFVTFIKKLLWNTD